LSQKIDIYGFGGGLDTSSAALAVPPGSLIFGLNYEPLAEGYGRVEGYERFDGSQAPSNASFWKLAFDAGASAVSVGDTVTGATSGATGTVAVAPIVSAGAWGDGDAAGDLILAAVTGSFVNDEQLQVAGTLKAMTAAASSENEASTADEYEEWLSAAQEIRRQGIGKVPGSGPVRGVAVHSGSVYAWRDDEFGNAAVGYKATSSGWQVLTASQRIPFTSGASEVFEGDVVTGDTSGATATVIRIITTGGTWVAGSAAGFLHVVDVDGTFEDGETLRVGDDAVATGAAAIPNTFGPGGRYHTISHNFFGASNRYRLYGSTGGATNAFELVSDSTVPIFTGMTVDKPQRIFEVGNSLGLTFEGGSAQFSATGEPLSWEVILGAGEISIGTEITDVVQANDTTVAFFGEQKVCILQGHDTSDFVLDTLTEEAGAEPDTAQRIARTVYIDLRGLRSLDATQAFGNFKTGALSQKFEKHFKNKRKSGVRPIGSIVSRSKSHYRLFWNDGTGLSVYMGGKIPEAIPFDYSYTPHCFGHGELADGEALLVGAEDGYVYRLDSGTSYDGEAIEAACMTPFNPFKSAMQEKRFHKVTLELQGPPRAQISITAQFNYGDLGQPIDTGSDFYVRGGGGFWEQDTWGSFYWSDPAEGVAECPIDGMGRNASFVFSTRAGLTEERHILQAYAVHHSPRKVIR